MNDVAPESAARAGAHVFPLRVYFEDTDAGGIVYYANYLKFAERARTEMLRAAGIESGRMMAEQGIGFVVRRCVADYKKPARLDDRLDVETRVAEISGASLTLEQRVRRDGAVLVALEIMLVCMDGAGRPQRMPRSVRACLTPSSSAQQQG